MIINNYTEMAYTLRAFYLKMLSSFEWTQQRDDIQKYEEECVCSVYCKFRKLK